LLPPENENDPAAFRERVVPSSCSGGHRHEIAAAYANLSVVRRPVRSSATAEDLPGATFAGKQDSS
jgi:phosphoenolpyruvate synthase/pyruvate phosphate dikinase